MKKIISFLLVSVIGIILIGCTNTGGISLKPEELTERERKLLTLTGNNIAMYTLDNLPDKPFSLEVSYEYYKGSNLIETNSLGGFLTQSPPEKKDKIEIGISIFNNKEISTVIRFGNGTSTRRTDLKDKDLLDSNISGFLNEKVSLDLDSEVYILQASKGNPFVTLNLGENKDEESLKSTLERNDENFLIKISIKEANINE